MAGLHEVADAEGDGGERSFVYFIVGGNLVAYFVAEKHKAASGAVFCTRFVERERAFWADFAHKKVDSAGAVDLSLVVLAHAPHVFTGHRSVH